MRSCEHIWFSLSQFQAKQTCTKAWSSQIHVPSARTGFIFLGCLPSGGAPPALHVGTWEGAPREGAHRPEQESPAHSEAPPLIRHLTDATFCCVFLISLDYKHLPLESLNNRNRIHSLEYSLHFLPLLTQTSS